MKKIYLFLLILITSWSFGQILSDDFNYGDNALLSANSWTAFSGAGTQAVDVGASNGLSYNGYSGASGFTGVAVGNAARLDNNGEDVNKSFSAITNGAIYYSFLINVTNASEGYFAGLNTTGNNFGNRLFVKPSTNTGKYFIGVSNTTTAVYGTTEFNYDTTYLVIVKYDVSTLGSTSVWVKSSGVPATEADAGTAEVSTSGSGSATISGFFLRQYNATQNITIDGLRIYSTWMNTVACSLVLGKETTSCNDVTYNLDTYTTTIPFTGGGSGTYTISTSSGVISGDNPSTVSAGNIIISGITEGVNVTVTITGSCTISKTILATSCKPINTLPYKEPFNYNIGQALSAQQAWSSLNTGDDILVTSGNLNYSGINSTGNSVSFAGAGAESRTPFTSTNSGTIYTSLLISCTDLSAITTDLTNSYIALYTDDTASSTTARLWIRKNGSQYQFGLGSGGSADTWSSNLYNVGTTQYLILGYDFNTGSTVLYENQANPTTPTISVINTTPLVNVGGFMLRQDASNNTPSIVIDELNISTTLQTLATSNLNKSKINLVKNTIVKDVVTFGAKANVQVVNLNGQVVKSASVENGSSLNVSSLSKGIYIIKGDVNGETVSQKIIKQ